MVKMDEVEEYFSVFSQRNTETVPLPFVVVTLYVGLVSGIISV